MSDIPSIKAVDVQLQYFDRNELKAWVTEHAADAAREPGRIVNGRFAQGLANNDMQVCGTTEERRQHLRSAVNNEQEKATKELTRAHKSLKKAHKLLVHQFLDIAASKEALRHRLARILKCFEYDKISRSQYGQQGHVLADTQGLKPKHKESRN